MLPVAMSCLDGATADRLLGDIVALHSDHQRDAGDTLMMAYDQGTYTKVRFACMTTVTAAAETEPLVSGSGLSCVMHKPCSTCPLLDSLTLPSVTLHT